jgi:hypothetical protein
MKYTRSVCLSRDTWEIVEELQKKTRRKVSATLEILILQWARFTRELDLQREILKKQADKEGEQLMKAKSKGGE